MPALLFASLRGYDHRVFKSVEEAVRALSGTRAHP
jgi:hypothetical protein